MPIKRKFTEELDDAPSYQSAKQLKLVPFPSSDMDMDMDVAMSESPMEDDHSIFHSRLTSCASMSSSVSTDSIDSEAYSPVYPAFELYPNAESPRMSSPPVGLMQPSQFVHLSQGCTQIPKLRVACEAGPNGQRSMWAMCEQCGAINMMES